MARNRTNRKPDTHSTLLLVSVAIVLTFMEGNFSLPFIESVLVILVMGLFHTLFLVPVIYLIRGKRVREFFSQPVPVNE